MVALTISDEVVRWASPGCKEWAEGLAREGVVIESDWAALGWAIGSTRVLLDRRAAPLRSLDEVPAETQKFLEMVRHRAWFGLAISIMYGPQGVLYLWRFFHVRSTLECVGIAIVVLCSIIVAAYSLMERRRLKESRKDDFYDDLVACTYFYKEQLKRFDSQWIYSFSFLLCWVLVVVIIYHLASWDAEEKRCVWIFVGMFLLLLPPTIQQTKQNNLRRIEEIDALLAERDGVNGL
jgi:hypothetical protein